jgi:hypothetical protein
MRVSLHSPDPLEAGKYHPPKGRQVDNWRLWCVCASVKEIFGKEFSAPGGTVWK